MKREERKRVETEKPILYVGFDESNHGRPNEICVAAYSTNPRSIREGEFPKASKKIERRNLRSRVRDFTFVQIAPEIKALIPPRGLLGVCVSSLLQEIDQEEYSRLKIYLDGEWRESELVYAKDRTADILKIDRERITLKHGKNLDTTIYLVHLADGVARYIFRDLTSNQISSGSYKLHKRELILP